jgi:hypothetical protein
LVGFGLMAVNAARDRVEVLAEPAPYRPRPDARRRARLLSEHCQDARTGENTPESRTTIGEGRQRGVAGATLALTTTNAEIRRWWQSAFDIRVAEFLKS